MTDTFSWVPLLASPGGQGTLRTRKAQFGDGYSQEAGDGLNNDEQTWQLSFIDTGTTIAAIRDFIRAHGNGTSFFWTPPLDAQKLFRCNTYTPPAPQGNGYYQFTATFVQSFAP